MTVPTIAVSEVFGPTIQGEGPVVGQPTVFVRTGGCDYRCLAAGTMVTLHDLTQKPIERVQPGDMVLGYARVGPAVNGPLRLVPTAVQAVRPVEPEPTLRLVLDDGTEQVCSPDHRWWVERLRDGWVWKSPRRPGVEGNYREAQEIKPGDYLKGLGRAIAQPKETEAWRRGYLRGAFDGDGHISKAWVALRVTSRSFFDAVVSISADLGAPLGEYAQGVTTAGTPLYRSRLPEEHRAAFVAAIEWQEDREFARGYLAGAFDAEGHVPTGPAYYSQNEGPVIDRIQHALALGGYRHRHWPGRGRASRVYVEENSTAFLTQIDARCAHKRAAAANRGMNQQRHQVVSVERGPAVPLFDLQTGTENFIANGMVSHNCTWCDSLHAVLPEHRGEWRSMVAEEVMDQVLALSPDPILVTLSGGNPAMQPCGGLVALGHALGYRFCIETQGSITPRWLGEVDVVVLSPKPPSSGMTVNWPRFERTLSAACPGRREGRSVAVKVPVFDTTDLEWVEREVVPRFTVPVYLSVGNPWPPADSAAPPEMREGRLPDAIALPVAGLLERYEWLTSEVLRRRLNVRVLPQLHVLVWGNQRGR